MSNLWEKVKFIYADANQTDGYVECDIDKNYTLIWTITRYTKPTDKQLNDIKDSDIESGTKLNALRHQRDLLLQQSDWIVIREREEGVRFQTLQIGRSIVKNFVILLKHINHLMMLNDPENYIMSIIKTKSRGIKLNR